MNLLDRIFGKKKKPTQITVSEQNLLEIKHELKLCATLADNAKNAGADKANALFNGKIAGIRFVLETLKIEIKE